MIAKMTTNKEDAEETNNVEVEETRKEETVTMEMEVDDFEGTFMIENSKPDNLEDESTDNVDHERILEEMITRRFERSIAINELISADEDEPEIAPESEGESAYESEPETIPEEMYEPEVSVEEQDIDVNQFAIDMTQSDTEPETQPIESEPENVINSEFGEMTDEIENEETTSTLESEEVEQVQDIVQDSQPQSTPLEDAIYQLSLINSSSSTEERDRAAMNYYIESGATDACAAGIMGNAHAESQLGPTADSGYYTGLFQWNPTWWEENKDWAEGIGLDPMSFEAQIRMVFESGHYGCLEKMSTFKAITNPRQAAEYFAIFYEGCEWSGGDRAEYYSSKKYSLLNLRKSEAEQALSVYYGATYSGQKPYIGG